MRQSRRAGRRTKTSTATTIRNKRNQRPTRTSTRRSSSRGRTATRGSSTPLLNSKKRSRSNVKDHQIVIYLSVLIAVSLVIAYSISPALAIKANISESAIMLRHLANIGLGLVAFILVSNIPTNFWQKMRWPLLGLTMLFFILLLTPLGLNVLGATRWISLFGFTFQPVELAKFSLIIYMASFLSTRSKNKQLDDKTYTLMPSLAIIFFLGAFVVILQKDLGSMIVLVVIVLAMMFAAKVKIGHMIMASLILATASFVATVSAPHRAARLAVFADPSNQSEESLFHITQSLIAVGSGGLIGKGLGKSIQVYGYLPEAANDSVFSILAEKVGLVGSVALIAVYAMLLFRLTLIIDRSKNLYDQLLVAGVSAWIFSHVAINIAAMLGLIPLTGITLPFISFGGTSIVFVMTALGVAMSASGGLQLSSVKFSNFVKNS